MKNHTKVFELHGYLKSSWCLKIHVDFINKQKELFRIAILEQVHIKLIEVRFSWHHIPTQFKLYKIFFRLIIVLNFYQGCWWWLHVNFYYPLVLLLHVKNFLHGSCVDFVFVLTRKFIWKVYYTLCISRITCKTIVDKIMS